MYDLSQYSYVAAFVALALAAVTYASYGVARRAWATAGTYDGMLETRPRGVAVTASLGRWGTILTLNAFVFLTGALGFRWLAAGHGPFSNMYEFSLSFVWGTLAAHLYFEQRYGLRSLAILVLPVCLAMLSYAATVPSRIDPLVPALQNNLLLTVHVAVAIVAYGSFTVAFAAALMYLIQPESGRWGLPRPELLDEIGYRAIVVGFPFLTLVIVLGAVWAEVAWGAYWSWDPKETASLVTWLIYAAYLHARIVRGWRGQRSAWLLVLGFGATLFTYFGNLFYGGLHSYAGLGQ